ncbi:OmpA family protein [Devosia ginsengisoli]|uniref:OmpA family protein n=1 Tax=Devosia ginsengisoli TaxID=400770 RepID=A0A5B8LR06_9HYPH|nr:OmpA family protein [Devosia ginsengisoli]QDZ09922.1 OmpA family protein [Devosia ginsengisoli]
MIRDLIKWVVPGLATVLGGTTLCLAMTSTYIADDLAARSATAMSAGGYDWAELSLDARDLTLTGTTTDQAQLDSAVTRLAGLAGIRSVATDVTLAPTARPYILHAELDQGAIALSGAVPNETTRQRLLALAGSEQGALELRSGMPERRLWVAGAEFAIDRLQYFDQGEAVVSDLTVSLNGRAKSERAFRDLLIVLRAGAPTGLELGEVTIAPALVSPYAWNAAFDGKRIDVSGYVPDDALVERYRTAEVSGAQVATGLALGSGEPTGFAELSQTLLEQLARLEYGAASITDGQSTLSGAPATLEIAQGIVETLEPSGTIVVLEPPRIADYWMSATRQAGGVVVFDGYAPDEATREAFSLREGADTSYLKLGRGAPERYRSGADFGLDALEKMSEGRIALRDNVLTIVGTARSGVDYDALLAMMAGEAPQGLVLARAEISAPRAATWSWSVSKDADGAVALSGLVPSAADEAALLAEAGEGATTAMTYASGEPNGFVASADTAIDLLQWLRDGTVTYDGMGWTVTGTANSAIDKGAIEADFTTRQLAGAGWSMAIAVPPPAIPEIAPYLWSATRTADGVTLIGHVPTPSFKSYLAVHAGDAVVDSTELGLGAPSDFVAAATAGLDAVLGLVEGEVSFDGTAWSLNGRAESEAQRDTVLAALAAATDSSGWAIDIAAPAPEPIATTPYIWSATKAADGAVTLRGLVPVESLQRFLVVRAGGNVSDETSIDATAPEGFAEDLLAALGALAGLSEGSVSYDGAGWTVSGTLANAEAAGVIDSAIATAKTPVRGWTLALTSPPEPEPVAEQVVEAEPTVEAEPAAAEAEAAVESQPAPAPGVETVAPVEPPAVVDPNYAFSGQRSAGGEVVLSGQLPSDPALRYFASISGGDIAAISIAEGAPETFLPSAETGLRALLYLLEGQLDFANGAWSLRGIAADDGARTAVLAAIAADPGAADWTTAIDLPPPPPEPEPAPPPPPVAPVPVDITACAAPIAEFSARNSILFQSGAALIAAESDAALDELALDLAACPDAVVHIEGHTDADGDEGLNMALSVARAEAVVEALVTRGVAPARLYAVGYGETAPIADNDTAQGKRLNRRIVVSVQPEHY